MTKLPPLMIVDDDADVRHAARLAMAPYVAATDAVASPEEMAGLLEPRRYGCVLLDMNFATGDRSGRGGIDALAEIKARDPALAIVLMTSFGSVSLAVESIKRGAHDFMLKPWRNQDLLAVVKSASEATAAARKGRPLESLEREAIERTLAESGGNIARAAAMLGVSRPGLYRRMAKHGF